MKATERHKSTLRVAFILGICALMLLLTFKGALATISYPADTYFATFIDYNDTATAITDAVGSQDLANNGATVNTASRYIDCDGLSDYLSGYDMDLNSPWTITFWLYADTFAADKWVFSKRQSATERFQLWMSNTSNFALAYTQTGKTSVTSYAPPAGSSLGADSWTFVTILSDGTTMKILLNNTYNVSVGSVDADITNTQNWTFCALKDGGAAVTANSDIWLTQFYIFNRSLAQDELAAHSNSTYASGTFNFIPSFVPSSASANVTFVSQSPSDITSTNLFSQRLNITYFVNLTNQNATYPLLNYSLSNGNIFYNGTQVLTGAQTVSSTSNVSTLYSWAVDDNYVYPGTYNLNETTIETTTHITSTISGTSDLTLIELQNLNTSATFSYFEIMLNTSGTAPAALFYCNSTYTTGNPSTSTNCYEFATFNGSGYNHTHTATGGYSMHNLFNFPIVAGKVGSVTVTTTGYFIIQGPTGASEAFLGYVPNYTRANVWKTSTNAGATWTDNSAVGTPDAHLHQFVSTTTFNYNACGANATLYECSEARSDTLDVSPLPPTAPEVTSPTEAQNVTRYLNITWEASIPFNTSTGISSYNVSLLNSDGSYNFTINGSTGNVTSYYWDTFAQDLTNGSYYVKVEATDTLSQKSSAISPLWNLVANGVLNITARDITTNASITNFTVTVTNSSTGFNSSAAYSNTTGGALVYIVKGVEYLVEIDGPAYSYDNTTLTPVNDSTSYTFDLYGENSITIYFYDEYTDALITQNVTIDYSGPNSTFSGTYSGGSGYEDFLDPGAWTLTIGSTGYDDRIYFVTILANSHITLDARLLNSSLSADTIFHIIDQDGNYIVNATMTIQSSVNGSYVTIAQKVADFFGVAYFPLLYAETYRAIIEADDYVTKTADFERVETDYTIRLTGNNTQGYVTYGDEFSYTLAPSNVTPSSTSFAVSTSSADGRLEWFSVTTLLNESYVTTNVSGSPSGGTANHTLNLTPYNGAYVRVWYRVKSVSFNDPLVLERQFFIYQQNAGNYSLFAFADHYANEWSSDEDFGANWKAIIAVIAAVLLAAGLGTLLGVEAGAIVGASVLITAGATGWLNWSIVIISAGGVILFLALKGTGGR